MSKAEGAIAQLGERLHGMQEVGGSIPPGSTSLRRLRLLRLGKPYRKRRLPCRSPKGEDGPRTPWVLRCSLCGEDGSCDRQMKYVYILESQDSEHFYAGITDDGPARLEKHNGGEEATPQKSH